MQVSYGYMEAPTVRQALLELSRHPNLTLPDNPMQRLILIGRERILANGAGWFDRIRVSLFRVLLRNAKPATDYFGLGEDSAVTSVETNIEYVKVRDAVPAS